MNIKFILVLAITAVTLLACGRGCRDDNSESRDDRRERKEKYNKEKDNEDEDDNGNTGMKKVVYGAPYFPVNSSYALIPVKLADEDEDIFHRFRKEFDKLSESYSYGNLSDFNDLHNVIFFNKLTGEARSLLNANIYINRFFIPGNDTSRTDSLRFILFTTIEKDYNSDNDIDNDDGETVYITDYTGSAVKQVSPENIKLLSWHADIAGDMLYMTINMDSNSDKKFNVKDDVKILRTTLSNPVVGSEIISDSLKTQLNNIYK